MSKQSDQFYFENLAKSADFAMQSATLLCQAVTNFDVAQMDHYLSEIHKLEHGGDECSHKLTYALQKAFITPLEQEDLLTLSNCIDDVTDTIEDIIIHIHITSIVEMRPDVVRLSQLLCEITKSTFELLCQFKHFKKSTQLEQLIIQINNLEEEGDTLYVCAMKQLFSQSTSAISLIAWKDIYSYFEDAIDACEDVADIVQRILIQNS